MGDEGSTIRAHLFMTIAHYHSKAPSYLGTFVSAIHTFFCAVMNVVHSVVFLLNRVFHSNIARTMFVLLIATSSTFAQDFEGDDAIFKKTNSVFSVTGAGQIVNSAIVPPWVYPRYGKTMIASGGGLLFATMVDGKPVVVRTFSYNGGKSDFTPGSLVDGPDYRPELRDRYRPQLIQTSNDEWILFSCHDGDTTFYNSIPKNSAASLGLPLSIEVHGAVRASRAPEGEGCATISFRVINRSARSYSPFYVAFLIDPDIGESATPWVAMSNDVGQIRSVTGFRVLDIVDRSAKGPYPSFTLSASEPNRSSDLHYMTLSVFDLVDESDPAKTMAILSGDDQVLDKPMDIVAIASLGIEELPAFDSLDVSFAVIPVSATSNESYRLAELAMKLNALPTMTSIADRSIEPSTSPTLRRVTSSLQVPDSEDAVMLFDVLGGAVPRRSANGTVDLHDLPTGIYIARYLPSGMSELFLKD